MREIITIKSARYLHDFTLELTFSDGLTSEIDFTEWINSFTFFKPLKDVNYFKNFSLDGWTVNWENGADIAPETLYEIALKHQESKIAVS